MRSGESKSYFHLKYKLYFYNTQEDQNYDNAQKI